MHVTVRLGVARVLHHFATVVFGLLCFVWMSQRGFDSAWYLVVAGFAVVIVPTLMFHALLTRLIRARCPRCGASMRFVHVNRWPRRGSGESAHSIGYRCVACAHEALQDVPEDGGHGLG